MKSKLLELIKLGKKILQVTTISNTVNAFLIPHINCLLEEGYEVDLASNLVKPVKVEKFIHDVKHYNIPFQRTPLSFKNIDAYRKLKNILIENKYDIVHTHTPVASAIVRILIKNEKLKTKVIYTAHGFHFFKGAPIKNWLVYYPIEKYLSRFTDVLITINDEDYGRADKFFKMKKIYKINGIGIDLCKYSTIQDNLSKEYIRDELNIPTDAFILTSVGEINKNKNHITIIKALQILKNDKIHYIICGQGNRIKKLKNYILKNKIKNIHFLGFREDIKEILFSSDLFVFPSKREGLGIAAIEAMSMGLPLITSNVHGIKDYSIDGKTGYVCQPMDSLSFANSIERIYMKESKVLEEISEYNILTSKKYAIDYSVLQVKKIYSELYKGVG